MKQEQMKFEEDRTNTMRRLSIANEKLSALQKESNRLQMENQNLSNELLMSSTDNRSSSSSSSSTSHTADYPPLKPPGNVNLNSGTRTNMYMNATNEEDRLKKLSKR